jgi:hypothetical protein
MSTLPIQTQGMGSILDAWSFACNVWVDERIVYTDTGYGEYIGWTGFRYQCFTNVSQWQVHAACFEGPDVAP